MPPPNGYLSINLRVKKYVNDMKNCEFVSPEMWILTDETESLINASVNYGHAANGTENGSEIAAGLDFWI